MQKLTDIAHPTKCKQYTTRFQNWGRMNFR